MRNFEKMIFVRFGSKGASVSFSRIIAELSSGDQFILTNTADENNLFLNRSSDLMLLDRSGFIKFIFSVLLIIKNILNTRAPAVVLMPSPFDWLLIFKKGGMRTIFGSSF